MASKLGLRGAYRMLLYRAYFIFSVAFIVQKLLSFINDACSFGYFKNVAFLRSVFGSQRRNTLQQYVPCLTCLPFCRHDVPSMIPSSIPTVQVE